MSNGNRTRIIVITKIPGKEHVCEDYYLDETAPFKDVVDRKKMTIQ